jgi:hypothetical protein
MAEPDLLDDLLEFGDGDMRTVTGVGRAYVLGQEDVSDIPLAKRWERIDPIIAKSGWI